MPTSIVKTPRDERLWEKAKGIAEDADQGENWAYIMGIYKKMNPDRFDKSAAMSTSRAMYLREEIARALQRPLPPQRKVREVGAVVRELLSFLGGEEFADSTADRVTQGIIRATPRTASTVDVAIWGAIESMPRMASRVASRHIAYTPGHRTDKGYSPGSVTQQPPDQGVGSQTPFAHDRDGKPVAVRQIGMMKIPGYEWHNKSESFHRIAADVSEQSIHKLRAYLTKLNALDTTEFLALAGNPTVVKTLAKMIGDADQYLTGKRRVSNAMYERDATAVIEDWNAVVQLSDGGYSRLTLTIMDGPFMGFDEGSATPGALERWRAVL